MIQIGKSQALSTFNTQTAALVEEGAHRSFIYLYISIQRYRERYRDIERYIDRWISQSQQPFLI